jgi:hypothetical protein
VELQAFLLPFCLFLINDPPKETYLRTFIDHLETLIGVEFSEVFVNAYFLQQSYNENCANKDKFSVVFGVMKIHWLSCNVFCFRYCCI